MKDITRREFLKTLGVAGAAVAGLSSCLGKKEEKTTGTSVEGEIPTDKMTMRVCHSTGDKVSLLGYGMMRLPHRPVPDKEDEEEIDQEAVNELVDYAIASTMEIDM